MSLPARWPCSFFGPAKTSFLLGCLTIAASACSERPPASSPPPPGGLSPTVFANVPGKTLEEKAEAHRVAAQQGRTIRGIEDEILRLEQVIPGLGGFFVDSTGTIVVHAPTDQSQEAVYTLLQQNASTLRVRPAIRERFLSHNGVKLIPAKFPFSYLVTWQIDLMQYVGAGKGIFGVDADEKYNTLTILIDSAPSSEQYARQSARAIGIPDDAIRFKKEAPPMLANLRAAYRPTAGGLQIYIASSGTCSLGFNVTTSTDLTGFITAGHCAPDPMGTGIVDTAIGQPNLDSANKIGNIHTNPLWNRTDVACGGFPKCTIADVLFAEYDSGVTNTKRIALTSSIGRNGAVGSISVVSSALISMVEYYTIVGDSVDKIGRTTGWTRGVVGSSCVNLVLRNGPADSAMHLCVIRTDGSAIGQGDSGAPVFYEPYSGLYAAYGIVVARSAANGQNDEGKFVCTGSSSCHYYYSDYISIVSHLGFTPVPY